MPETAGGSAAEAAGVAGAADGTEYEGVGVGTATVAGPVARTAQAPPEPPDVPATATADEERRKALAALAAVAADLRARGAAAGGGPADVLEAQALMAGDPDFGGRVRPPLPPGKTAARASHR